MIEKMLDTFKEKYGNIRIDNGILDITSCFVENDEYIGPRQYGENSIKIAYVTFGAPFISKYNQSLEIDVSTTDAKVMSALCIYDLRNTTLHEVKDILDTKRKSFKIQGYNKNTVSNIEKELKIKYNEFDEQKDTAFIFAGDKTVYKRAELHKLWLGQIIQYGSEMLNMMNIDELNLMEKVFPHAVLKGDNTIIKERSYMYGRPIHTIESEEFLKKKVKEYKRHI